MGRSSSRSRSRSSGSSKSSHKRETRTEPKSQGINGLQAAAIGALAATTINGIHDRTHSEPSDHKSSGCDCETVDPCDIIKSEYDKCVSINGEEMCQNFQELYLTCMNNKSV